MTPDQQNALLLIYRTGRLPDRADRAAVDRLIHLGLLGLRGRRLALTAEGRAAVRRIMIESPPEGIVLDEDPIRDGDRP